MNKNFWALALLSLTFFACGKDKEEPTPPPTPSALEVGTYINGEYNTSKFEKDFERIVKEGVDQIKLSRSATTEALYLKSVNVNVNLSYSVDSFRVVLDFGEKTILPSNNVVKGKIILTGAHNKWKTQEVVCTYSNFFFNTDQITGSEVYTSTIANNNSVSTVNFDIIVIHPDKTTLKRKGVRITEWTKVSSVYKDNEFKVTGNWESTYSNYQKVGKGSITDPLIIKNACQYGIVDGTIRFVIDSYTLEVDYQNECSNKVSLKINGLTYPYTIL